MIGGCDYFSVGFMTLNRKAFYEHEHILQNTSNKVIYQICTCLSAGGFCVCSDSKIPSDTGKLKGRRTKL